MGFFCITTMPPTSGKAAIVSKTKKQNHIWDELIEAGREVLRELEEMLNPNKRRHPAPVPIPVRPDNQSHTPPDYS